MKIFYSLNSLLLSGLARRTFVATIGVFDGLHKAHKEIVKAMKKKAGTRYKTLVITFDPHPLKVIFPAKKTPLLVSFAHRMRLMEEEGIDAALVLRFDKKLARMPMEEFIKKILGRIRIKELCVGANFFFGRYKKGTPKKLRDFSGIFRYRVTSVQPIKKKGLVISSTRIRRLIKMGKLSSARDLLGRPVSVLGTVVKGCGRGRSLGFPTANIDPHHEAIPLSGVYAVKIRYNSVTYGGILNIGTRPTFRAEGEEPEPSIEAHIFNFRKNIYGEDLEIGFVKKIRNERKFRQVEQLKRQLKKDMLRAKKVLRP